MNRLVLPALAIGVSVVSATTDALRGRIPNVVTVPALIAGLLFRACSGEASAIAGLLGCAVAGSPPWLLHRATRGNAIGGGDVKLFAALGAITGATSGLEIEATTIIGLCFFVLVSLTYHGNLFRVVINAGRLAINPFLPSHWKVEVEKEALTEVRMGPSIAVAVLTTLFADRLRPWMPWM